MNTIAIDNYSSFQLEQIKTEIEQLNKFHHVEILKIFKKHQNVKLNENKSGVFVNLSFLPKQVIDDLNAYLQHVKIQEHTILQLESQKEIYKNFFINENEKEDKDKTSFQLTPSQTLT